MKQTLILVPAFFTVLFLSCNTDRGNERLGDASEKVGKSAATAVKSLKKGIVSASQVKIELSEKLSSKGIELGKIKLDSKGGRHNVLNVYMIFNKNFNASTITKVYDTQGLEIGRTKTQISAKAGDAKYVDIIFDKNTNIDRDYRITLE
jgi:hypothetical protein